MKITNFKFLETIKRRFGAIVEKHDFATVDVTTTQGIWPFNTEVTETKQVFRRDSCHWRFMDTGRFCPDSVVENLYNSYVAKQVFDEAKNKTQ